MQPEVMYHYPRWSPDERSIVVVGMTASGTSLLVFPVEGGPPTTIRMGDMHVAAADWTRDAKIRFTAAAGNGELKTFVMDRNGGGRREVQRDSVTSATPDSSLLLFEVISAGSSNIFAMDGRRTKSRALTRIPWAEQASFSPDGRSIVFERRFEPNRMDRSDIVIIDPSGAKPRKIASGTDPSWSPDGKVVLYKEMDSTGALWVAIVDPVTKRSRRLGRGVHPQWSPSGTRIVYMIDRPDHSADVYIIGRDGGSPACLTCAR
jgi:Tol biopolymer transport system component